MKYVFPICLALLAGGCASEQELTRRDAEDARREAIEAQRDLIEERRREAEDRRRDAEDRRRDAEERRLDGEQAARDYAEYREGFARALGKTPSQLTAAERARMDREYYGR